jgi:type II secretory pathway pseudopilin PulG
MSLVELLVVVAILGMLAVTVLPNLSNTAEARRSREAARMVSSFIAKAQSRALGNPEWSGFMVVASSSTSFAAVDFALADVPPVYRGDMVPALLTITGSVSPAVWRATGTQSELVQSGSNGAAVQEYDLIRFDGRGPWYEIHRRTDTFVDFRIRGDLTGGAATADMEMSGMNRSNTPWPPQEARLAFEVLRQPVQAGSPLTLPDGRAIDLFWSGYGPPQANSMAAYQQFTQAGSRVSALFDGTGRLRRIFITTPSAMNHRSVTGPVFLLVGRAERATGDVNAPSALVANDDTTGANWQYPDSWWIAIDPMTGVAKSAECTFFGEDDNRNGVLDANEDRNGNGALDVDVIASQRWIRSALLGSGR